MYICCTFVINFLRMANIRQNHNRQSKGRGGFMSRIVSFTVMLIGALISIFYFLGDTIGSSGNHNQNRSQSTEQYVPSSNDIASRNYLPTGSRGEVVHHKYFSLSYNEKHEQAEWVAYQLTEESLRAKNVPRAKRFNVDYSVNTQSAFHSDYTHSGYTRGHMAPAGDMAFSQDAMKECFLMSNMSPQTRACNNGVWKELEEQVRDWAYDHDELYIVTGPFLDNTLERIGKKNKVSVPKEFYKIILDLKGPDIKAIGFIIPNDRSDVKLQDYAVSVDKIEQRLGIDVFAELIDKNKQEKIESTFDTSKWKFDKKRYKTRVNSWNKE